MDGWTKARLATLVVLGAWMASAHPTFAHGGRLPFDTWGGFAGDVLRCQRVIAQAAAQCATGAWTARRACRETTIAGGTCDEAATVNRIAVARRTAQDAVDDACSERQAISLQYLGTFDLQQDLISFCRDWERAAAPACSAGRRAMGPVRWPLPMRPPTSAGTLRRRRCMDRVAASPPGSVERSDSLEAAGHRLEGRSPGHAPFPLAHRRAPDFAVPLRAVAARPHITTTLATRADCVERCQPGRDSLPAAVCGNGVVRAERGLRRRQRGGRRRCPASCVN
jgi:hypothetical protein